MARCIFENLSKEQAILLADWFEGQGEQDCIPWFEEWGREDGVEPPITDIGRKNGFMEVLKNGDVIVYCK